MVVVDMEETTVRGSGVGGDLRVYREFIEDPIDRLCDVLSDFKLERSRIGIEMAYLPARDHLTLQKRLAGVTLVPADKMFSDLRMIKTQEEVNLLGGLSRITDRAIGDALKSARMGMTEMDLAGSPVPRIFPPRPRNF